MDILHGGILMNLQNAYICSVCGGITMGAGTCDESGNYKNGAKGCCPFCHKKMLDTGIRFLEYTSLSANDPNYKQHLIDTIVIPYGKFNTYERKKTLIKMQRNSAYADSLHRTTSIAEQKPSCPYCKSTNLRKIGVVGRSVSVGLFGLASGKIGKQWHCNNCNSDF